MGIRDNVEDIYIRSGDGSTPTRTAVVTVRLGVPADANKDEVIGEYVRWLDDDEYDAVAGTRVVWEDDGEDVPEPGEEVDDSDDDGD